MKIRESLLIAIVVILSVVMSIGLFGVTASAEEITASGTCGDNLTWRLDSEGVLTISGSGEMKTSPLFIQQPWYDYRSSVKKIVIDEGVTSIGTHAFYGCTGLESITIPNGIASIGNNAFHNCIELKNITIPDSVTEIEYSAFSSCSKLESITIPFVGLSADATEDAAHFGAIFGYVSSTSPSSDYHLENDGYYYTFLIPSSLKNVTVGNEISGIGDYAFNKCTGLESVYISYKVKSIGNSAFNGCSALENVYYGGTISEKQAITVSYGNNPLNDATWHFGICVDGSEHSYNAVVTSPTCTSTGYTTYTCDCGHKYISDYLDKASHTFGEWYTTIYATCTSEGTERRNCSDCYYYETRTIRKAPHDYSMTKTTPNCTEPGREIYTCFDCGHAYSLVYADALGHNMSSWTVVSSATCTEDGNRRRECTRACDYREEETLPANGHNYYDVCDSTCDVCGAERTAPHNYVWVVDRESNCGIIGIKHQECTLCHTKINENTGIDTKGNHVFDSTDDMVCNVCELDFVWLHFDSNGGSYVSSIKVRLEDFNELPSSPSKSGYNFDGWSTEKNGHTEYSVGYLYYATEANVILYAQWNKHCATCSGTGRAPCYICDGDKLTERTEYYKCYSCNGDGSISNTCINCYGSGCYSCKYTGYNDYMCSDCSGKGLLTVVVPINCSQCDNNGKQTCLDCNGTGNITRTHVSAPEKPEVESIYENTITLKEIENGEYSIDGVNWQESPIFEDLEFDKEYSFYQRYAKTDTTYTSAAGEALNVTICSHSETEWIVDINPSCSKAGSKHEECTICKDILSTETIEKLPHSYSSIMTNPTCTDQGYTTYTCICGDKYVDNYVDALGHNYDDWYEVTTPTCTVDGLERHDCSRCEYYETNILDKLGHSHNSVVTAPTCTEKGYITHTCHCGDSYIDSYVDALGHNCGEWYVVTTPTCTTDGVERRGCERCEYYETDTLGATGHTYIPEITLPTCTERGYKTYICSCGDSYIDSYTTALGHSYGAWYEVVASTCTTNGSDRRDCSRCSHFETKTVDALGHNIAHLEAKAPTCTESGWEAYDTCSRCNYSTKVELSAIGHSVSDWIIDTKATCKNDGSKYTVCTLCHTILEESIIPMAPHSYVSVVKNPTCTEQGFTTYICSECENSYVGDYVTALSHNYTRKVVTDTYKKSAANCTEAAVYYYCCATCDTKGTATYTSGSELGHEGGTPTCTEKAECTRCHKLYGNVLEHDYALEWTEDVPSTCTTVGIKSHHCMRCEDRTDVTEIPAAGHIVGDWIVDTEPTCAKEGSKHQVCSVCNATTNNETIPLLVHNYVLDSAVSPTCTTTGLTEGMHCSSCNEVFVKQNVLDKIEHVITIDERVEASCTAVGLTEGSHCSVCNTVIVAQIVVAPTGHSYHTEWYCSDTNHWKECACGEISEITQHAWNDGLITKEATVDEEGTKTYTCAVCNHTKDESIAKLPPQPDIPPATDEHINDDGLSAGAVVGIVVGSTVSAGVGGFSLLWFVIKKKSLAEFFAIFKK